MPERTVALEPLTALLARILRTEPLDAHAFDGCDLDALYQAAVDHDVLPLVADATAAHPGVPEPMRARLREAAGQAVAVDLLREMELTRALSALTSGGIVPLVVKGSHLAYTHYARPDLRSRIDSDLLIPASARGRADAILTNLGYQASAKVTGELSATQQTYTRIDAGVPVHALDVHWRLASPQAFAHVLSYEDLLVTSVALPSLGPSARVPSNVHALVIACIHRVAHHEDAEELKWFVDVHLLASRLSAHEWERFVQLASDRRVGAVCRHSLARTMELLRTSIPDSILTDDRWRDLEDEQLTASYLAPRTQAQLVVNDLRALSAWRERARLLGEHVFPSEYYMRTLYAPASTLPLPLLYLVRVIRGAGRWIGFGKLDPRS